MMLMKQLDVFNDEMVKTRRYLHMHTELSHQEVATPVFIADRYGC